MNDVQEVGAIGAAVTPGRKEPLLIGSVEGTMGHAGHASGFVSLVKLLYILETGVIPATANFNTPHPLMKYLVNGSMKVKKFQPKKCLI